MTNDKGEQIDLLAALDYVDPDCHYEEWLQVGMALHYEGYSCADWEAWSRRGQKYKEGDCSHRWNGFGKWSKDPVTGATILKMACSHGYSSYNPEDLCMEWDDVITDDGDGFTFRSDYNPANDFRKYISTIFEPEDIIAYVVDSRQNDDGKWIPANRGCYDRTAKEILEALDKHPDDLGAVVGDWQKDAGAWIRFNPVDGQGVNNANVTKYRFALVESDDMPIPQQNDLYRSLNLPIAALVHSGGKSLHAIVHIDAKSYDEYQKRVNFLYEYLEKNEVTVDKSNRNPSKLSRMPGVDRKGVYQKLVATNIGCKNWEDWQAWIDGEEDDTPDFRMFGADQMKNEINLRPVVIDGILKLGNVMLLTGASKAGKSTTLMELAAALSLGESWMGRQCTKSKVLYCNMEIDPNECEQRIKDIYLRKHWKPSENLFLWHLRGKAFKDPEKFANRLLRKANAEKFEVVIIDPIYKLNAGDENDASKMAQMFVQFDRIAESLDATVIISHHHSKGSQSEKNAMDRASGSGVFARSPDAVIDMMELYIDDITKNALIENYREDGVTEKSIDANGAWQIQYTLRYFPRPQPDNVIFSYPVHILDTECCLSGCQFADNYKPTIDYEEKINSAFDSLQSKDGEVNWDKMAKIVGVKKSTLQKKASEYCHGIYCFNNSGIVTKNAESC